MDTQSTQPKIRATTVLAIRRGPTLALGSDGQVTVGDTTFETDILIRGDGRVKKRKKKATDKKPHTIDADELERLCKGGPRLVVIGTGHSGEATLAPEAELFLQERRIECQMLPTPEATDAFNQATGRKAALLHVTC